MIFHKQFRLIKIYGFKDKTLNACSHNVLCATLSCSGDHLGFLINNNKNINLIEGSCKEHYYQVTVPSHMWVLRRHFKLQPINSIIDSSNLMGHLSNNSTKFGSNWYSVFFRKKLKYENPMDADDDYQSIGAKGHVS